MVKEKQRTLVVIVAEAELLLRSAALGLITYEQKGELFQILKQEAQVPFQKMADAETPEEKKPDVSDKSKPDEKPPEKE